MHKIPASVGNAGVEPGHLATRLLPVLGAFKFLRVAKLEAGQALFLVPKEVLIAGLFPVERVTTSCTPRSTPTVWGETGNGWISSSTRNETKYRPAVSLVTVTVVGLAPSDRGRLHWIGSGSLILARVTCLPSHVKAEVVYSAAWRPYFFLIAGWSSRAGRCFFNRIEVGRLLLRHPFHHLVPYPHLTNQRLRELSSRLSKGGSLFFCTLIRVGF